MEFKFIYDSELGIAKIVFRLDDIEYVLPLEEDILRSWLHIGPDKLPRPVKPTP